MTEKEKMEKGELYDAAIPELIEQLLSTRDKIFELNHLRPSQLEEREKLIREIIGTTPEKFIIISPFFCDYGHNIHLGKNFFANYNCVMLDEAPITIGDNVFIAPNVSFYTAGHPPMSSDETNGSNTHGLLRSGITYGSAEELPSRRV